MTPSTLEGLRKQLADWNEIEASKDGFASLAGEVIQRVQGKISLLTSLLEQLDAFGMGFTLKHGSMESWGIILPDASDPGRYRWQGFREDGLTGHCTFDTPQLCLGDMLDDGYEHPDPGALDRLAATPKWARGMEVIAVIQACNCGLISWEEANQRHAQIKARYQGQ